MFRLHSKQQRSQKSGDSLDFKFSHFQALQVPKGWDRLFLSIVSVETGKTIAKSAKASVKNGSCRWTESLSDTISTSAKNGSKDSNECLRKLVVAMGSTRSSVLGEATINLASYRTSEAAVPVSLTLKKCNYGTILQVKIHCLTPNAQTRDEQLEDSGSHMDDVDASNDDMESRSDVSDISLTRSVGSSSSNHFDSASQTESRHSRELSFSASGSRYSFDSIDGSLGRDNFSPGNNLTSNSNNHIGRQDSSASQDSSIFGSYSFNDSSKSNSSPFNLKVLASRNHPQCQRDNYNQVSNTVASSPSWRSSSSKDLLEAAETKIEELRVEAKMWEQNARKLMTDVERFQNELKDQSTCRESLEVKLSDSHKERDNLKEEIARLKILLKESVGKQTTDESIKFQVNKKDDVQNELEDELKLQKESNASLALQLKKTQESNIELVAILQELEDTIEKQKQENSNSATMQFRNKDQGNNSLDNGLMNDQNLGDQIVSRQLEDKRNLELEVLQLQGLQKNLEATIKSLEESLKEKEHEIMSEQSLRKQALASIEAEWQLKLEDKEEQIDTLESKLSEVLNSDGPRRGADHNLIKEIGDLKQKIEELERDCNELTDENLELLLKLKETRVNLRTNHSASHFSSNAAQGNDSFLTSESESRKSSHFFMLQEDLKKKEILIKELERKFADLELQLQISKDKTCLLDKERCKYQARAEEQDAQIATLQQQLVCYQEKESETKDYLDISPDLKISESLAAVEIADTMYELHEQIEECMENLKNRFYSSFDAETEYRDCPAPGQLQIQCSKDYFSKREQVETTLQSFYQLKYLIEEKLIARDEQRQSEEVKSRVQGVDEVQDIFVVSDLTNKTSSATGAPFESTLKPKPEFRDSSKEMSVSLEKDKLEPREHEAESPSESQQNVETRIANLLEEKRVLEEKMKIMQRDAETTSKCLDDVQKDLMLLKSSVDGQVSANKVLERKSSELESGKHELEVHLSELENENVQMSERICGMEAQLRYLTNEKESSRLELQNSESYALSLKEEITRLQGELDAQKTEMKQKLQGMQRRWLEAQEECDYLKVANKRLQGTAESLMEEFSLLERSNGVLRKQKMELNERCSVLEAELRESEKVFSDTFTEVEALEGKYMSLLDTISTKEKAFSLELEALLQDNKDYKEKLDAEESLLSKKYLEKMGEVENLRREVLCLRDQISAPRDGNEAASEAIFEVSRLRADKAALIASLEEVKGKLVTSDHMLNTFRMEYEAKLQGLLDEHSASKQNQEILSADHEKLLELLEDVKSSEERHKSNFRGLEVKLKASEYERLQAAEEISSLKVQLQKKELLQNEIVDLTKALNEAKFEYQRLEVSFQILSDENNELKAENVMFLQKISDMQVAVSELEDCKRNKVALEEKVLRLEGDLTAREALGTQEAELKNELAQVRRVATEFQRKIRYLEEEKQECLKKAQGYEEELKQFKEAERDQRNTNSDADLLHDSESSIRALTTEELKLSQVDSNGNHMGGNFADVHSSSKIQLLETELAEALEANEMYKAQLRSLLSEEQKDHPTALHDKSTDNGKTARDRQNGRVVLLEKELKDLQERYSTMSLKYAEVEAEREQLVLKLKPPSKGRSWFS